MKIIKAMAISMFFCTAANAANFSQSLTLTQFQQMAGSQMVCSSELNQNSYALNNYLITVNQEIEQLPQNEYFIRMGKYSQIQYLCANANSLLTALQSAPENYPKTYHICLNNFVYNPCGF